MHNDGYVDLQVNGYAGADFCGDGLTAEELHVACERMRADGVAGCLATVITDDVGAMAARLGRIVELREGDPLAQEVIWGIHIEGPFLNGESGYIGAHPKRAAIDANIDDAQRLLDAAGGLTRIVTLAPERDPGDRVTRLLADQGIIVAAGHSNASLEELKSAIDAGLTMFTHLGNGCPMQMHRHDNIVQRVLSLSDQLWISFIADCAHVPLFALGNYLRVTGLKRVVVITDAISAAGLGPGRYTLGEHQVDIGDDLVPWAADRSHFVGSATTYPRVTQNLRDGLGLNTADIAALCCDNPRRLLKLSDPS